MKLPFESLVSDTFELEEESSSFILKLPLEEGHAMLHPKLLLETFSSATFGGRFLVAVFSCWAFKVEEDNTWFTPKRSLGILRLAKFRGGLSGGAFGPRTFDFEENSILFTLTLPLVPLPLASVPGFAGAVFGRSILELEADVNNWPSLLKLNLSWEDLGLSGLTVDFAAAVLGR